jgi:hypothetical protein
MCFVVMIDVDVDVVVVVDDDDVLVFAVFPVFADFAAAVYLFFARG